MAAKKKTNRRDNTEPLHQALDRIEQEPPRKRAPRKKAAASRAS